MELIKYASLAKTILSQPELGYLRNKEIIESLFNNSFESVNREKTIQLRLVVIDSFYSTNLNKRYFGIDDLVTHFLTLGSEEETQYRFTGFLENTKNHESLFTQKIGITKHSLDAGNAHSIISKYVYFLTKSRFPIYDSIVKETLPEVLNRYSELDIPKFKKSTVTLENYYASLVDLSKKLGLDYDTIDNYLWLYGKVKKHSYSLFTTREEFTKIHPKGMDGERDAEKKSRQERLDALTERNKKVLAQLAEARSNKQNFLNKSLDDFVEHVLQR